MDGGMFAQEALGLLPTPRHGPWTSPTDRRRQPQPLGPQDALGIPGLVVIACRIG
jgi:hypothetical protein